tara:strand:+ start:11706 stop:12161 length:456 start_codon:yes stop_codon:yes gene_type:complete
MATIINGTNMVISVDESTSPSAGGLTAIAAATSCSCQITIDAGEVTDKSSGDRKEFVGLSSSWTIDAEAFYSEDGSGVPDLNSLLPAAYGDANASQNGVAQYPREVMVRFTGGTDTYTGTGYITSLSASGGVEDAGTLSISIQGTGDLTIA